MEENTKARLRRHGGWVILGVVFVVVFATRFLLDVFADWPTAVEWLLTISLSTLAGWVVGVWLRAPGRGADF